MVYQQHKNDQKIFKAIGFNKINIFWLTCLHYSPYDFYYQNLFIPFNEFCSSKISTTSQILEWFSPARKISAQKQNCSFFPHQTKMRYRRWYPQLTHGPILCSKIWSWINSYRISFLEPKRLSIPWSWQLVHKRASRRLETNYQ